MDRQRCQFCIDDDNRYEAAAKAQSAKRLEWERRQQEDERGLTGFVHQWMKEHNQGYEWVSGQFLTGGARE